MQRVGLEVLEYSTISKSVPKPDETPFFFLSAVKFMLTIGVVDFTNGRGQRSCDTLCHASVLNSDPLRVATKPLTRVPGQVGGYFVSGNVFS